ncbi:hypothetical protein [Streptomyces sp. NPDC093149]|uniref:hypothetical protein n=1 Tax=Streptomyces sp. NPDC093149 TaxID=3366031 RepID=UPI0037F8F28F
MIYTDRFGTASFWCDQLLTRTESRGLPVVQATVLAAKAEMLTRKGEFDEAATTARTTLTLPARARGERSWAFRSGVWSSR